MICDCHVNIWNPEHQLAHFTELLSRARSGQIGLNADADTLFDAMREVDRAILFTLKYGDTLGIEGDDEVTARAVAKYPQKFIGFAHLDPRHKNYIELLRQAIEDLGLKGVKTGPIYSGVPLSDPRMTPVYEYCVRNDLPLTLHMGTTFPRKCPIDLGRPIHVEPVALQYPDLKIVMAHLGHPWFEECIVIVRIQPNVFADTSALCYRPWQFYNMLVTAQEYRSADKLYFGTDFPFATVTESIEGLKSINRLVDGTNLPRVAEHTIDCILHSNPLRNWWHHPMI